MLAGSGHGVKRLQQDVKGAFATAINSDVSGNATHNKSDVILMTIRTHA
jgi:hypothetical protein